MKHYYWLSFSRVVPKGERGNLGAAVISSNTELSRDDVLRTASRRGLVPPDTMSIRGYTMDEATALEFPLDRLISPEELDAEHNVLHVRSPASVCSDCAEALENGLQ